jgi:hypothetical protein
MTKTTVNGKASEPLVKVGDYGNAGELVDHSEELGATTWSDKIKREKVSLEDITWRLAQDLRDPTGTSDRGRRTATYK